MLNRTLEIIGGKRKRVQCSRGMEIRFILDGTQPTDTDAWLLEIRTKLTSAAAKAKSQRAQEWERKYIGLVESLYDTRAKLRAARDEGERDRLAKEQKR